MKKILIQLDSDRFASTFDFIVASDSGADTVQSYAGVTPEDVRGLLLGALFPRGIPDLASLAVWIGGSDASLGERLLEEARRTFFGPFKVSLMLDSNGCNTTAATAIAKLARHTDLRGKSALVIGPGPVGLRAALLLSDEGSAVRLASVPADLIAGRFDAALAARSLAAARAAGAGRFEIDDVPGRAELLRLLDGAEIVAAAGPAGCRLLSFSDWAARPGIRWLLDFNLTEPLGIEGVQPADDFADREGKRTLGALAVGNPKMKVHKACLARLFERNDQVLDTGEIYRIAKRLL